MAATTGRSWLCLRVVLGALGCGLLAPHALGEPSAGLVPLPVTLDWREGVFRLTPSTCMAATGEAAVEARKLADALAPALGFRLGIQEQPTGRDCIAWTLDASVRERLGEEGYELDVGRERVTLRAAGAAGLFYGSQSLRQLLPTPVFGSKPVAGVAWQVPCVHMVDHPRFAWRGLLIDPARHFIPVADCERYLEVMAAHKLNRLQIHLTDDQGWRIEIRKYPELVRIGSVMDFTTLQRGAETGRRTGGYYTQDDIRHLVRYAAARHITLVPEIEMPAHTGAAIVSYPMLGLHPDLLAALPPGQRWTAHEGVLAPRPRTVSFLQDVLAEILELFPGRAIHIGGDEANLEHWRKSPELQTLMRDRGLKDEAALHSWFLREMDEFLSSRGRQLVGWDEILQGGLAPGAVVMSWRGEAGGITAARAGHDVVMAPTSHTYFDYYQGPPEQEPKAIGGFVPLERVFRYEPIPMGLDAASARRVLGAQGQLWGEYLATPEHRLYMTYPRAAALAEVLWSPKVDRDYEGFLKRLAVHGERWKQLHVPYRPW